MSKKVKIIDISLICLVILDILLCIIACAYPQALQRFLFENVDSGATPLLVRLGATWATFALLQTLASIKWKKQPMWLAVIAGVRLTEACADWFYLMALSKATIAGYLILIIVPIANISLGFLYIYMYRAFMRNYRR